MNETSKYGQTTNAETGRTRISTGMGARIKEG
jgi:hypothetical protein